MVDATLAHLLTAQDYEDRGVRAMHAVLIDLLMPRDARTRRNRPALIAGLRVQGADAGEIFPADR